jgi:DNA-binding transcriptional LysR family regulator
MISSDITIRQIEGFRAFMQRHTVTGAAEMLHISQPAMSCLLADFEESVGYSLFDRNQGRRLVPTPEAHVLYNEVKRAFVGLERIALVSEQIRTMRRGSLRIASAPALSLNLLPDAIVTFMREHDGVDVSLIADSSLTALELLAGEQCDFCFLALAISHPSVHIEVFYEGPMACIVPQHHQLACKPIIRPEDLADEVFVSYDETIDARITIDKVFVAHGVQRKTPIDVHLSQSILALVEQGLGVSLIEPVTALYASTRVAVRKFEPSIPYKIYLATLNGQSVSALGTKFISLVRSKLGTTL